MKRILLYCPNIAGHRMEYIHHIYESVVSQKNVNLIVAVPEDFSKAMKIMEWQESDNISFVYINPNYLTNKGGLLSRVLVHCKGLRHYMKELDVSESIVLDLMEYNPILPLLLSSKHKVSGIIYNIFLYDYNDSSVFNKLLNKLKFFVFSQFDVFNKVFILNDEQAAQKINSAYHSRKFTFLPDPVVKIATIEDVDIREKYGISQDKTILLHPGGMLPYKGTIEILKALKLIHQSTCHQICVIFAGRVTAPIRKEFDDLFDEVSQRVQLILESGFISFEYLGSLFNASDWVLIPYKSKTQSSGILGHAANFKIPVVTVEDGLIGNLTHQYNLGVTIPSCLPSEIARFIDNIPSWAYMTNNYVESHSVESFTRTLLAGY